MDDEDTARSGFGDQDLRGISKLNVPLRDPIDWFDPRRSHTRHKKLPSPTTPSAQPMENLVSS